MIRGKGTVTSSAERLGWDIPVKKTFGFSPSFLSPSPPNLGFEELEPFAVKLVNEKKKPCAFGALDEFCFVSFLDRILSVFWIGIFWIGICYYTTSPAKPLGPLPLHQILARDLKERRVVRRL